jgi:hypothetical protein
MKITGPGSGQPTDGVGQASDVERAPGGKEFKIDKTEASTGPTQARPADPDKPKSFVGQIGQRLESGEISPGEAVEEVLGHVLDKQLGEGASPQLRSEVESRVRQEIESDAFLQQKIKSLE